MKMLCGRCGSKSFRYSKKERVSYCLTCGWEISEKEIEKLEKK